MQQGQTYMRVRQGEQQRATRIDIFARWKRRATACDKDRHTSAVNKENNREKDRHMCAVSKESDSVGQGKTYVCGRQGE